MINYDPHELSWSVPDLQKLSMPKVKIPMKRSISNSKTSNIIETETPKYSERDPPIEDTKDPVNCIKRKED